MAMSAQFSGTKSDWSSYSICLLIMLLKNAPFVFDEMLELIIHEYYRSKYMYLIK